MESCEVILIRVVKIGSTICIKDLGRRRTGNSSRVIQMAKDDEEAKALGGDDILATKPMIKFLDIFLRIASEHFFPVQNPLMALPMDNFSPFPFLL